MKLIKGINNMKFLTKVILLLITFSVFFISNNSIRTLSNNSDVIKKMQVIKPVNKPFFIEFNSVIYRINHLEFYMILQYLN